MDTLRISYSRKRSGSGDRVIMVDVDRTVAELDGGLTLSRDIRRACQLLEKLQKSKYCGEVTTMIHS